MPSSYQQEFSDKANTDRFLAKEKPDDVEEAFLNMQINEGCYEDRKDAQRLFI